MKVRFTNKATGETIHTANIKTKKGFGRAFGATRKKREALGVRPDGVPPINDEGNEVWAYDFPGPRL